MKELLLIRNGCTAGIDTGNLHNYSLTIREGTICFICGYEGYYTQALADVICGKVPLISGSLVFAGKEITTSEDRKILERCVFYSDFSDQIIDSLNILDNLAISLKHPGFHLYQRKKLALRIETVFEKAGIALNPKSSVRNLSTADRYRLCLVKSLLVGAKMVIVNCADSSFIHFDIREILPLIRLLHSTGMTVLIISRYPSALSEIADYYQIIDHGMDVREWRRISGQDQPLVSYSSRNIISPGPVQSEGIVLMSTRVEDSIWESMRRAKEAYPALMNYELPEDGTYVNKDTVIIPAHSDKLLLFNLSKEDNLILALQNTNVTRGVIPRRMKEFLSDRFDRKYRMISGNSEETQDIVFRKMLSIERWAMNRPSSLVMEEPFAGMDNAQTGKMLRYLRSFTEEGIGVYLFISGRNEILEQFFLPPDNSNLSG